MPEKNESSRYGGYDENALIAELYDFTPVYTGRADVDYYLECAREAGGRILELGCGTGRVLIPLAEAGYEITGLDLSEHMLSRCREKLLRLPRETQQRVRLVQGNMADFNFSETFGLVLAPFRPFQHLLSVEEQVSCLGAVHRHLAPGGRFILDVFQPDPRRMFDPVYHQESEDFPEVELPGGRRFRRAHRIVAYHRAEQINDIEMIYYLTHADGRQERFTQQFPFRYFFRYEIEHLLARGGFRLRALYGNYDRSPLRDDSVEMIFMAEKAGAMAE